MLTFFQSFRYSSNIKKNMYRFIMFNGQFIHKVELSCAFILMAIQRIALKVFQNNKNTSYPVFE